MRIVLCVCALLLGVVARAQEAESEFTKTFAVEKDELQTIGRNPYFILEPGYQLSYAGREKTHDVGLTITVLDQTRIVDGVETRVVEERETKDGQVVEVSRNYYAISRRTNSIYYFGEEVDLYSGGKLAGHEGAWLSGEKGAKFGLAMPGTVLLGARYYQEIAPGEAMDRAEVVSLSTLIETPAGKFENCLKTVDTTPLAPGEKESKIYAPGVGLLNDGPMKLVRYGIRKP